MICAEDVTRYLQRFQKLDNDESMVIAARASRDLVEVEEKLSGGEFTSDVNPDWPIETQRVKDFVELYQSGQVKKDIYARKLELCKSGLEKAKEITQEEEAEELNQLKNGNF